jgi:acyl carrier protein
MSPHSVHVRAASSASDVARSITGESEGFMSVKSIISHAFKDVAAEQARSIASLTDNLILNDCGLDSLCLAILVSRLEDELGVDPFTASDNVYYPVTFGDFIKFYEDAVNSLAPALSSK